MAKLNTKFYHQEFDSVYTDGSIEIELCDRIQKEDKTLKNDSRWPIIYHTSPLRHNILNWYPFNRESEILEVGAGCGAITGLLCSRAKNVTACELTLLRSKINYYRHKNNDNLEIMVGDFLSMQFERKYDYVILNGVLEYAAYMSNGDDPYKEFLQAVGACLKPKGKILLAIENRLGIKYFSGAAEDHTGNFFAGINGYCEDTKVKTFSINELSECISDAGLHILRRYYPFPDYKFPSEILSDETINKTMPICLDQPLDLPRASLFESGGVWRTLQKEKIAEHFSNSFLFELSVDKKCFASDISYVKINQNRFEQFALFTYINRAHSKVIKKALTEKGEEHIVQMAKSAWSSGKLRTIPVQLHDNYISYDYITQLTLYDKLIECAQQNNKDAIINLLQDLCVSLIEDTRVTCGDYTESFQRVFGDIESYEPMHWKNNLNIDLVAGNIFCLSTQWLVIDNEWEFPFAIPCEYVIWRTLVQLSSDVILKKFILLNDILNLLQVSESAINCFKQWEIHFAQKYVGIYDLSTYFKPIVPIDIQEIIDQCLSRNQVICSLYLDVGEGFTEEKCLKSYAKLENGKWNVSFNLRDSTNIVRMRWDPLEGSACRIMDIQCDNCKMVPLNAEKDQEPDTFFTYDPQYITVGSLKDMDAVDIFFSCELIDWTQGYYRRELERDQIRADCEHLQIEKREMLEKNTSLETQIDILNSTCNQLNEKKETITAEKNALKEHLDQKIQQYECLEQIHWQQEQENIRKALYMKKHRIKAMLKLLMGREI